MSFQELIKQGHNYNAVIAVVLTIFIIIVLYMVWLDVKMRKLEDKNSENNLID